MRIQISIHTALAGCDITEDRKLITLAEFQSTQPSQAVTVLVPHPIFDMYISIHTALAGCDTNFRYICTLSREISIHTALAGCDFVSILYMDAP